MSSSNITHAELVNMRTNLVGGYMGSMFYGINLCVYIAAIYFLFNRKNKQEPFQWTIFIFATLLFAGATMITGAGIKMDQITLIDSQVNPNDPTATGLSFNSQVLLNRLNLFLNGVYIATNFIADLLILYRLYFVWGRNLWVVSIPFLIFLASTACSIIVEYQSTAETSVVISFAIPYFCLSVALTIISTLLITVRLMAGRRVVQKVLGTSHSTPYVSVAAMIIESAAIYSIVGIFFIAFLITKNPGQNVLNPMIGQAMCISPNLIIARVAAGQSFSKDTFTRRTTTHIGFVSSLGHFNDKSEATKSSPPMFKGRSETSVAGSERSSSKSDGVTLNESIV
ncbi:hypothetical protein PILCRDRAFT_824109 [Piloderma croceum F 1598]|uniref:Uncharacterized protein n=1 Tax=Piloderma croceum (strain F 1598) TaxID=765440 RepID=A0A0C3F1P4_PILCF|nr:hypothetical protein PILCRDRAFT_824109 [Piloderma croceum F 1598]